MEAREHPLCRGEAVSAHFRSSVQALTQDHIHNVFPCCMCVVDFLCMLRWGRLMATPARRFVMAATLCEFECLLSCCRNPVYCDFLQWSCHLAEPSAARSIWINASFVQAQQFFLSQRWSHRIRHIAGARRGLRTIHTN